MANNQYRWLYNYICVYFVAGVAPSGFLLFCKGKMSNTERPRARPKHRNRNRILDRSCTPADDALENHLQNLFEEQEILHNLLINHRPVIKSQLEDLGGESNYEFDTPDEEPDEEKVLSLKVC